MSGKPLVSQFLEGNIRHRRTTPVAHAFDTPIGLYAIRLDEWDRLPGLHPGIATRHLNRVWFRRGGTTSRPAMAPWMRPFDAMLSWPPGIAPAVPLSW